MSSPLFQRLIQLLYHSAGLKRGLGRAVKMLAHRIPALQSYQARLIDARIMTLDLRQTVSLPYFLQGSIWEEEGETHLARIALQPGDHAIDIGANLGWYTTLFAECVGASGKVLAFEPHPIAYGLLATTCRAYSQVSTILSALSDQAGNVGLSAPDDVGQTQITEMSASNVTVPTTTLDLAIEEHGLAPVFVKCDVEGAELKILRGAEKLLRSDHPPIWMVELDAGLASRFGHHPRDVVGLFTDLGYHAYRIHSQHCRLVGVPLGFDFRFDAVFVPEARMGRVARLIE